MKNPPARALILLLLCCFSLLGSAEANPLRLDTGWQLQYAAKAAGAGAEISQPGYQSKGWYKATVPGTVLTSLVNDGVYPQPLYGLNNTKIPDSLCRTSYWYRTAFTVPSSYRGRQTWLRFDGINYIAHVWVNGRPVGIISGAFARGLFNVTSNIAVGKINALAVEITPEPNPGVAHQKTQATGTGRNGGVTAADGPTFLCSIGWDWIPTIHDRDTGIWQDVSLSDTGPVTIHYPDVTSTLPLPSLASAELTIQATLRNSSNSVQNGVLIGAFGKSSFRVPVTLPANGQRTLTLTPAQYAALHVAHPRLWWPNGYGPQNLYTLHLRFMTSAGQISDTRNTTFGIRQISYFVPGSNNLTLSVNGVPILCKGGDWGMDEAMKRIPASRIDAEVLMHKEANYTIIRNWVGQSTSEALYDACDKYGILLWDEFFQPNPADGPNPNDSALYLANVRQKILRFRSHPSIAIWCARNEGNPPPVIGAGIQALLSRYDPGRLYQPSSTSGHGVQSGGPYRWQTPASYYTIDAPFKTEIGSVSIPTLEAVHAMMPKSDWGVINDDWAEHDFCSGAQAGNQYPYEMAARYGPVASLADFVRKGQLMNYDAFRAMYEGREVKLFEPTTGIITWMSNPAQPSFVWQLYSWDLEPNSALFAVRKACEPIHLMMNQTNGDVVVINNTPHALSHLSAKVAVYDLNGKLAYTHTSALTAAPSAATDVGPIAFPAALSAVYFVKLDLTDAGGHVISDNFYWRRDPTQAANYQALNRMPMVALDAHVMHQMIGPECIVHVTLRNPSRSIALMAHVQLRRGHTGHRVLPVFYSSNYVSLVPGASKTITIKAAKADLEGDAPLVLLDGWNVTVKPAPGIMNNTEAIVDTSDHAANAAVSQPIALPIKINCGGSANMNGKDNFFTFGVTAEPGSFIADNDFSGGNTDLSSATIDTSVPNAAPEFVYQSERWGPCVYTIPVTVLPVDPNKTYTVQLDFAETTFDAPGQREFNVDINGQRVLANFDIFAAAGGADKAIDKDFTATANAQGNIVIQFGIGAADQPSIKGIEIL